MERFPIDSDALASLGYDPARRVLEVEFTSGRIYQYFGVPPREVQHLVDAPSRGGYFSRCVRDRYPFEVVH